MDGPPVVRAILHTGLIFAYLVIDSLGVSGTNLSDGGRRGDALQILLWSLVASTYVSAVPDAQRVNRAIPDPGCHTSQCSSGTQSPELDPRQPATVEISLAVHANGIPACKSQAYARVPSIREADITETRYVRSTECCWPSSVLARFRFSAKRSTRTRPVSENPVFRELAHFSARGGFFHIHTGISGLARK